MSIYLDVFMELAVLADLPEGLAPGQIYARHVMTDPADAKPVMYLCRITEEQYQHLVAERIPFSTWATLDKDGKKAKLVTKIKDTGAKDKDIPVLLFGDDLRSPGSPIIRPDATPQETTAVISTPPSREITKD